MKTSIGTSLYLDLSVSDITFSFLFMWCRGPASIFLCLLPRDEGHLEDFRDIFSLLHFESPLTSDPYFLFLGMLLGFRSVEGRMRTTVLL